VTDVDAPAHWGAYVTCSLGYGLCMRRIISNQIVLFRCTDAAQSTCGRWWSALWSLWRHRVWDTLVSTTHRLAPTRWTFSTVLGQCGRAACSEVYSNLLSFGIVVATGLEPIFSDNLQDGRCDLQPSQIADYKKIITQKWRIFIGEMYSTIYV